MHRSLALALLSAAAVLVAGCGGSSTQSSSAPAAAPTTGAPTTTATAAPTATTTTAPPVPELATFHPGDDAPEVQGIQTRLIQLGYRPGEPDGHYSAQTSSAVMAFQKHEGLERDGIAGPETQLALLAPVPAGPGARSADPGPRIEVDLDRQILFVIGADGSVAILNSSTGSGRPYQSPGGGTSVAYTPTGSYAVYRRVDAEEHAPLGILYRPLYFTGGFAVHGSPSVPGYPASHGCVRLSNADQDWLFPQAVNGTPVLLYAGTPVEVDPTATPGA